MAWPQLVRNTTQPVRAQLTTGETKRLRWTRWFGRHRCNRLGRGERQRRTHGPSRDGRHGRQRWDHYARRDDGCRRIGGRDVGRRPSGHRWSSRPWNGRKGTDGRSDWSRRPSEHRWSTSLANPNSSQWQAKGDQHRTYHFAEANTDEPYRLYVPTNWDGQSKLPLGVFLHGSGSNENTYVDQNSKQLLNLAQQHGYILVSPLGDQGAYGNFLRLTSPFGDEAGAAELMAQVTVASERTNELSEKDVINVLERASSAR